MPNDPAELLEWNEENLSKVISDLYKEAETNQTLHGQLLADPFTVLSSRIQMPEEYRGGVFARERNKKSMLLYVPVYGQTSEAVSSETAQEEPPPDYEMTCTTLPVW